MALLNPLLDMRVFVGGVAVGLVDLDVMPMMVVTAHLPLCHRRRTRTQCLLSRIFCTHYLQMIISRNFMNYPMDNALVARIYNGLDERKTYPVYRPIPVPPVPVKKPWWKRLMGL